MVTSQELYKKWGDPFDTSDEGSYMTVWKVPSYVSKNIPTIPRRIYCNKQMALPLEIAFLNVIEAGVENEIRTWDGCFQVRPIRGYEKLFHALYAKGSVENAMKYTSVHSWGFGIDINAAWNGLGKKSTMSKELVECFTDVDFDWGGTWTRPDGMHFQLSYIT